MKNSLNYTSFSNLLVVSRKKNKTSQKNSSIINAGRTAIDDPSRFCPPYLMQPSTIKGSLKK